MNQPHSIDVWLNKTVAIADAKDTSVPEYTKSAINIEHKHYEKWDIELNKMYKALINKLGSNDKNQLRNSQRAWLKFFEYDMKFISNINSENGLMGELVITSSKSQFTKDRTCQLLIYSNMF